MLQWARGSSDQHLQASDTPQTVSRTRHMSSLVLPWHCPLPCLFSLPGTIALVCKQSRRQQGLMPLAVPRLSGPPTPTFSSPGLKGTSSAGPLDQCPQASTPKAWFPTTISSAGGVDGTPTPGVLQHGPVRVFLPYGQWLENGLPRQIQSGWRGHVAGWPLVLSLDTPCKEKWG